MPSISSITVLLTLLIACTAIGAVLSASQTAFTTTTHDAAAPAVTSPASFPGLAHDLKARQANPGHICGFLNSNYSLTCIDHSLSCVGTVLTDGDAYQYYSTPDAGCPVVRHHGVWVRGVLVLSTVCGVLVCSPTRGRLGCWR